MKQSSLSRSSKAIAKRPVAASSTNSIKKDSLSLLIEDLSQIDDEVFQVEVKRRNEIKKEKERLAHEEAVNKKLKLTRFLFKNRAKFLPFLFHSRNDCSDISPTNGFSTEGHSGYPRCVKCAFMTLEEWEIESVGLGFELVIQFNGSR